MKLDGLHIVSFLIGIAAGYFLLPMVLGWISSARG